MSENEEVKKAASKTTKKSSGKSASTGKRTSTRTGSTVAKTSATKTTKKASTSSTKKSTGGKRAATTKSTTKKAPEKKNEVVEEEIVKDVVENVTHDLENENLANSVFEELKELDEADIPKSLRKNTSTGATQETVIIDAIDFKKIDSESVFKSSNRKSSVAVKEQEEENSETEKDEKEVKKTKKGRKIFFTIFKTLIILGLLGIAVLAFLLYGPWSGFRDWYITSAMTTMTHQWLATMFYSQDVIDEVMSRNKVEEIDGITDTSKIKFETEKPKKEEVTYANEYERQVLERDANATYKKIDISGKGYDGFLAFIYDPSKIHTMVTSKLNIQGEYVTDMAKREGAVLAINGGGFDDPNYSSNGGTPTGLTIVRGKTVGNKGNFGGVGGVVGFTEDNVLTLGRFGSEKAQELKIRDAVTTSCPFLIINGESTVVKGNGGWGDAARTVIGQRRDGIVLMLVINGRNYAKGIIGTDMKELIDIMERYGAYNAACLDGGTSTVMVENGEIINDPVDGGGRHKTRWIPTAFGVFEN